MDPAYFPDYIGYERSMDRSFFAEGFFKRFRLSTSNDARKRWRVGLKMKSELKF
jgi:hypothetical protein